MRARPVRPNIFLPVVRFGVADSDWFSVLLISCAGYLLPVPLGITILYIPLQMWTWLIATAGTIAFFNYIRIGRKPYWLQHTLKSFSNHRQYRALPNGRKRGFHRPWLLEEEAGNESSNSPTEPIVKQATLLLEHHNRLQAKREERWNPFLTTTN